ncbi:hypothetical protein FB567DRAFT_542824 [Paraphoma chrysanthemicola]|uniref:Uncharacterized protein n=1 Tax=Paraphoma chrysanthemicola TaxID=798071 RepID=A0A8K0RE48_9PLEO|nr:hypothetical protein FB567DRAFT_542824 [Paraphoma chrysanthemicola]
MFLPLTPRPLLPCLKPMSTPTTPTSITPKTDSEETPKASLLNAERNNMHRAQPPPHNGQSGSYTPFSPYYDDYNEREEHWRDPLPQIRHIPPTLHDDEAASYQESDTSRSSVSEGSIRDADFRANLQRRRARDLDVGEWSACIGVWLLTTCMVLLIATAVVLIWLLVTQ